jgi:hypothetical protein
MMTSFKAFAIVSIVGMLTAAVPAMAASLDSSSADALSARFTADDATPGGACEGHRPAALQRADLVAGLRQNPEHCRQDRAATGVLYPSHGHHGPCGGQRIGVDAFSSEGDTKVATAALALNLSPPPPTATGIVPLVPLQVIATSVQSSASFSNVIPEPPVVRGTSNFGALTISGTLVGKTLTFEGTPPPNHVLFSNAGVTITLNGQLIVATTVTCVVNQGCTVLPGGIFVKALHVTLTNANVFGRIVTGDFFLGESQASGN